MEPITVKYKVLDARAKVPAYATPGAAAADLCAVLDAPLTVAPMQRVLVPTGLAIGLNGISLGTQIDHGHLQLAAVVAVHRPGVHRRLCARRGAGRHPARCGRLWLYRKITLFVNASH